MKRMIRCGGLTLVELLVGIALMSIVVGALTSFFQQTTRSSMQSAARADLQQETLNTQQLITGRLKEAYLVFPAGTAVNFGSGGLSKNPVTSTFNWTVGTHPILALVLPPRMPGATCGSTLDASDGCYRFFAYYGIDRSQWISSAPQANQPQADSANTSAWVLAEYRDFYPGVTTPPASATVPNSSAGTAQINLLSDYVAPANGTPAYTMFQYGTANGLASSATNPVNRVTLNLATARQIGGQLVRLPSATEQYTVSVTPANLLKAPAN